MEHIDGSEHQWFGDERWFDLIVLSDDATSGIDYAQLQTEMKASGDAQLQKLAAAEVPAGLFKESLVGVGVPASEIVQAAKTLAADVIVIATHGRTGLKHVLLGSVVESVVRRAPCPVLVVREREHEFLAN